MNSMTFSDLVYLGSNILYIFSIYKFIDNILEYRRVNKITLFCLYITYYVFTSIAYMNLNDQVITAAVNLLFCFAITFLYKTSIARKLLVALVTYLLGIGTETVTAFGLMQAYGITMNTVISDPLYSMQGMLFSKVLLFTVIWSVSTVYIRRTTKTAPKFSISYWIAVIFIPFASAYILYVIFMDTLLYAIETPIKNGSAIIAVIAMNCFVFYLYEKLFQDENLKHENMILLRQNENYSTQITMSENYVNEINAYRHDAKNHLSVISSLCEQGAYDGISSYIMTLTDVIEKVRLRSRSGNIAVDAILNSKIFLAESNQIDVELEINMPKDLHINQMDITVIIGNLMDNAIEACCKLDPLDRKIEISIQYFPVTLIIEISNTYQDGTLHFQKGKLISSKKSTHDVHGLGIENIRKIADRYCGEMTIKYKEIEKQGIKIFTAGVLLYMKNVLNEAESRSKTRNFVENSRDFVE